MKLESARSTAERLFPPVESRVPIAWDWDAAEQAVTDRDKQMVSICETLAEGADGFKDASLACGDNELAAYRLGEASAYRAIITKIQEATK